MKTLVGPFSEVVSCPWTARTPPGPCHRAPTSGVEQDQGLTRIALDGFAVSCHAANRFMQLHRLRTPIALATLCSTLVLGQPVETAAQRDTRMHWWREAKFGLFIHWGVYAVPAGTYHDQRVGGIGEWIMRNAQIPVAEYRAFAREFNPVNYDPEAWAALAEAAGMRYLVITAKHHDGFALYPSEVTDWDVADATPYGRDLLTPLAEAARRHGLKFGTYYSQAQDWTHPGGAKAGLEEGQGWDPAHRGSFDAYLRQIAIPQTREILTRIRPDVLWWDTPTWMTAERAQPLHDLIRLRPGLITNNRLGGGFQGDTETPEQHIPATGYKNRDWETCMTMNDTWGYKDYDQNWKSTETLIRNLVDIVSKGGNYLLNVGPTARGDIPQPSIDRLRAVGAWMKVNSEAIYGTTASPFRRLTWGRCTKKVTDQGATLYLHVFEWPADGQLRLPGLKNSVRSASVLASGQKLAAQVTPEGITLSVPLRAPDTISSTLVVEVSGPLAVDETIWVSQSPDGALDLLPDDATVVGETLQVEHTPSNLGYWVNPGDYAEWTFKISHPGELNAVVDVASLGSTRLVLELGDQRLQVRVPSTGDYGAYRKVSAGSLRLPAAKEATLKLKAISEGWTPVNVRSVTLVPPQ